MRMSYAVCLLSLCASAWHGCSAAGEPSTVTAATDETAEEESTPVATAEGRPTVVDTSPVAPGPEDDLDLGEDDDPTPEPPTEDPSVWPTVTDGLNCVGAFALTECDDDTDCGGDERCIPGGCNDRGLCAAAGSICFNDGECPSGASCSGTPGVCISNFSGCEDDRTCSPGYHCEAIGTSGTQCVDRRLPCATGCPLGFSCELGSRAATTVCMPALQDCSGTGTCSSSSEFCADLKGDGSVERCYPTTTSCIEHLDCGATPLLCGVDATDGTGFCSRYAPCTDEVDCLTGDFCDDVHRLGQSLCHAALGCQSDEECAPNSLCLDLDEDGVADCTCFDTEQDAFVSCG